MAILEKENISYILPNNLNEFIEKNKIDMMEHIISCIEHAVKSELDMVEVFQFKNSKFIITISKKEFEDNLNNIFQYYMKNEIYELCERVIVLQNLLKRKNDEKKQITKKSTPVSYSR